VREGVLRREQSHHEMPFNANALCSTHACSVIKRASKSNVTPESLPQSLLILKNIPLRTYILLIQLLPSIELSNMTSSSADVSNLTEEQQLALQQFTAVTDQGHEAAIPLLKRCQWNVQVTIELHIANYNVLIDDLDSNIPILRRRARRPHRRRSRKWASTSRYQAAGSSHEQLLLNSLVFITQQRS
jgi:hypothetical protein